jgi:hypothetical protein
MQSKVLVAIDFCAPAFWAGHYAVKLAARLKSPLIFLGILPPEMVDHNSGSSIIPADIPEEYRQRLDEVVRLTQKEGVSLEIFLSSGQFFEEIRHFLSGLERFQFFVIGVPQETCSEAMEPLTTALKGLHRSFTGEILLVREQGKIASLSEFDQRLQGRKP